jgi:hypothetical protein
VRERVRPTVQEMQHQGETCPETINSESCNIGACNRDCELGDWSAWSECSQDCNGGMRHRQRSIAVPAVGSGNCPEPLDPLRTNMEKCNTFECVAPDPNPIVIHCDSQVDLVLVLDGSTSMQQSGWDATKVFTGMLMESLKGPHSDVRVACEVFSGPLDFEDYNLGTGFGEMGPDDMSKKCRIEWVTRFTNDTAYVAETLKQMEFPKGGTLTQVALGEAAEELIHSRPDVETIVLLVTDGRPISPENTKYVAESIHPKARLFVVTVGSDVGEELVQDIASYPPEANSIHVAGYEEMVAGVDFVNTLVPKLCRHVDTHPIGDGKSSTSGIPVFAR